jgi:hypothetical protein
MVSKIRSYLTQDLSLSDKNEYLKYVGGDKNKISWLKKGLNSREMYLVNHLYLITTLPNNFS